MMVPLKMTYFTVMERLITHLYYLYYLILILNLYKILIKVGWNTTEISKKIVHISYIKERDGFGTLILANADKYVGAFKNDMINGHGTYMKKNG